MIDFLRFSKGSGISSSTSSPGTTIEATTGVKISTQVWNEESLKCGVSQSRNLEKRESFGAGNNISKREIS